MNKFNLLYIDQENKRKFKEEAAPILDELLALNSDLIVGAVRNMEDTIKYFNSLIIKIKILANRFDREIVSIQIPERLYLFLKLSVSSYMPVERESFHVVGISLTLNNDEYHITIELPHQLKLTRACTPENNYRCTYKFNPAY